MVVIFARNVMLCAQFAVQRAFSYAPVSSIGRFGIVLADKTLKLSGVSVMVNSDGNVGGDDGEDDDDDDDNDDDEDDGDDDDDDNNVGDDVDEDGDDVNGDDDDDCDDVMLMMNKRSTNTFI